ncbi:hypothetical protein CSA37_04625 [Candidatus Fermentibacteria bacterium]|nr:MAG: hypothetical protein CSA37_06975 [Candidatus Fermentibacteria bacterium]PIE52933.1 MAG: hypothetical protein CSA37_04625 [Candidatus Fermentibacteria bacterium]
MRKIMFVLLVTASCVYGYGLQPSGFNLVGFPEFEGRFSPEFSSMASFSFTSGSYGSMGQGTYLGSMSFFLHPRVDAKLEMGYSRFMTFSGAGNDFGLVLGGVELNWRPWENTRLSFIYRGALPENNLFPEGM